MIVLRGAVRKRGLRDGMSKRDCRLGVSSVSSWGSVHRDRSPHAQNGRLVFSLRCGLAAGDEISRAPLLSRPLASGLVLPHGVFWCLYRSRVTRRGFTTATTRQELAANNAKLLKGQHRGGSELGNHGRCSGAGVAIVAPGFLLRRARMPGTARCRTDEAGPTFRTCS